MTHDETIQAWRDQPGSSEWQIDVTLDGYGDDQDAAEAMLDGFLSVSPESGAAVGLDGQNLSVMFGLAARTAKQAGKLAESIFVEAAAASGLEPVPYAYEIKAVNAEAVAA